MIQIVSMLFLWRRGRDTNPRPAKREAVFKTAAIDHSATSPSADRPVEPTLALYLPSPARLRCAGLPSPRGRLLYPRTRPAFAALRRGSLRPALRSGRRLAGREG